MTPIPFIDLGAQRERLNGRIEAAIAQVLAHGQFVFGPEVARLESMLAEFAGVGHAVTCANGTDAISLILMAYGIGPGDAVFVPAFTFAATAEMPALHGATPVLVDIRDADFNMCAESLAIAIDRARALGLRPRLVMPVDLFGQPADYAALTEVAGAAGAIVAADAAQSFGASRAGRRVGALAPVTALSFFPSKPLGAYGDGGAVLTDDRELADRLRSLRMHGQGTDRYDHVRIGLNSRLDSIQAAVLLEKMTIFPDEIAARDRIARRYSEGLSDVLCVPGVQPDATSVWAQYTLRMPARDALRDALHGAGIPTAIHYPRALHQQEAYCRFPTASARLPVAEAAAREVLSLPMHPYLSAADQDRIIATLRTAIAAIGQPVTGVRVPPANWDAAGSHAPVIGGNRSDGQVTA